MKPRHTCCDKIGPNAKIRIRDSFLGFASVDEVKQHYLKLKKHGITDREIGEDDTLLFPDTEFSSSSFVSIEDRDVCVGNVARFNWVHVEDWQERLDLAAKCQEIYVALLSQGVDRSELNPGEILSQAQSAVLAA